MEAFEDLKSKWKEQKEIRVPQYGVKQVLESITATQKGQQITNLVLSITAVILVGFFFYVSAFKFQTITIGLLIMIGSLVVRIAIELFSIKRLRNINPSNDATLYRRKMVKYYSSRRNTHFIITPLIVLAYCVGFYILLPSFKAGLSLGFYNYIVVSAMITLGVLGLFIFIKIKQELKVLKNLKQ